jgi:hypothetical protein
MVLSGMKKGWMICQSQISAEPHDFCCATLMLSHDYNCQSCKKYIAAPGKAKKVLP